MMGEGVDTGDPFMIAAHTGQFWMFALKPDDRSVLVFETTGSVLEEQARSGFVLDESTGAYSDGLKFPAEFTIDYIVSGHIVWDGEEYYCSTWDMDYNGMCYCFGNA